jgi:hypothetical protein
MGLKQVSSRRHDLVFNLRFQHRDRALDYQHSVSMGKTDPSSPVETGASLARFGGLFVVRNANVFSN